MGKEVESLKPLDSQIDKGAQFQFAIATVLATLVYYKDPEDPVNLASCWFHTAVSKTRVDTKYYGLMITDTIALIWMFFLYLKNKRMSNK